MPHGFGRRCQFPLYHIHPCPIHRNNSSKDLAIFEDFMLNAPPRLVFPGPQQFEIDAEGIAQTYFFPEHTFFAKKNRTKFMRGHEGGRKSVFFEETDAHIGAIVIVYGMS